MDPLKKVNLIVVHHSLGADDVARMSFDEIRRFHTDPEPAGRGWLEVGYHGIVERVEGSVVGLVGRPVNKMGSHAPPHNADSLGLCFVGDFTASAPDDELLRYAARHFVAPWVDVFKLDFPYCLRRHDQVTPGRKCPGAAFDLRRLVGFAAAELGYVS